MRTIIVGLITALGLLSAIPGSADTSLTGEDRAELHAEIRSYLLEHPEILTEMIAVLEEKQQAEASLNDAELIARNSSSIFDDGFSYVGGNLDGDITIVEFSDYQCTFCRRAHPDLRELVESDGNIRLVIKEIPILGPGSELAARAAISALRVEGAQSYEALNNYLMELDGQVDETSLDRALEASVKDPGAVREGMTDAEVTRRLDQTRALAQVLQISGTPTFIFDNQMVRGYIPLASMRELVGQLRTTN
jgi:protein-disulfide isomerase